MRFNPFFVILLSDKAARAAKEAANRWTGMESLCIMTQYHSRWKPIHQIVL
jgi:hypothetical protein